MAELKDFLKKSLKKRIIETKLQNLKNKSIKKRIIETNLQELKNKNSNQKKFIKVNKGDILY